MDKRQLRAKNHARVYGHEIVTDYTTWGFARAKDDILANTIANTAYMPYITSMFMPRAKGDRPQIVPKAAPI